jgi:ABC-2 type transport system permease protein
MMIEADDFRQSFAVAKNEMIKFIRSRRFVIYVGLTIFVFMLLTFLPYLVGGTLHDIPGGYMVEYIVTAPSIIVLGAALFASSAIVSEFEERTALVLFTRPVKKTSIFFGKLIGCLILEIAVLLGYYLGIAVVCQILDGEIPSVLFTSLGFATLLLVAVTGLGMLVSSILKKSSICTLLTIVIMMLMPVIWLLVALSSDVDQWFTLFYSSLALVPTIDDSMFDLLLNTFGIKWPDLFTSAIVMIVWATGFIVAAWAVFIRREF